MSNLMLIMDIYELNMGAAARVCSAYRILPDTQAVADKAEYARHLEPGDQLLSISELR